MKLKRYSLFLPSFFVILMLLVFDFGTISAQSAGCLSEVKDSAASRNTDLPIGYNSLFAGSGTCAVCHNSMTNLQGVPVGIATDWRSTMMANSGKDPLWQAKVSHEGLVNPAHKTVLEDVCTTCHAPVGNFNAHHSGQTYYSMNEMKTDPLALDGVQCTVCHQVTANSMGSFSGTFQIGTTKTIWGPFTNPFGNPMINNTGYTPVFGNHVTDSRLCGSCHTLLTNSVDLNGVLTGEKFVEQAIYHEWKNSVYAQNGTTCQSCHVPRISDPVKISNVPPWLQPRTPFGMHQLAGANVFMGRLLKQNSESIGVTATPAQFDSTINRSLRMLQQQSINLTMVEKDRTNDSLFIELTLKNKAGHKFPSGFPSRRAFIELIAIAETGDTVFHSGKTDADFNIIGEDNGFEPHYNVIKSNNQVQIYEMVMGDVNGNKTTSLERGYVHLKDNRLPPEGFTTSHLSYDTIQIVGHAATDPDFNKESGNQGTGSDRVHFNIPLNKFYGQVQIIAKVYYQTVNKRWLDEMFSYTSNDINTFKSYYQNSNRSPVLVAQNSMSCRAGFDINLSQGWNSLSSFINPDNDDIDSVLSQISHSLIILVGEGGMIYPAGGIHTLTEFDTNKGYSIKLSNPGTLRIRGNILINKQKAFVAGWNVLPVLAACETAIAELNIAFLNQLGAIVELNGWKVYWPEKQVYSLTSLSPGNAYLVKLNNPAKVVFPACD